MKIAFKLALSLAVMGLVPEIDAGCCQNGWIQYEDHCYFIDYETRLTFAGAWLLCSSYGAYPVRLDTFAEYEFLRGFLKKTQAITPWIGLTDKAYEGIWRWYGTETHATFSDWGPGEPNNNGNEDCVQLYSGYDYRSNDTPCHGQLTPLCEKDSI
ncbi:C-type lectin domain family 4 member E-like [Ruditapes philippinarum]|uniref:C-type lectin domain family 4 member E-like n=1 Tax=Ruditapes philippinarum TaxID=129788 RepID=UPI00295BBF0E|nr:C-type lectin domain family 4 member E-like [Ruditapes philippinarum]